MKKDIKKLLKEIDVLNFYKYDEFEEKIDIDEFEFKKCIKNKEKCGFEFHLEVSYLVPINFDIKNKKTNSCGFYEDCYFFPFSEKTFKIFKKIGYGKEFFKNWSVPHYGYPNYTQIWDGTSLFEEEYLMVEFKKKYSEFWRIYDNVKIDLF